MTAAIPPRSMTMDVVICAYTLERWEDTLAAVESVRNQTTSPHEIVVVVDHNRDLYERFRAALPDVTVVENRKQRGLSGGKDTGVDVTTGDVVAFLDDDAVAHPDWLRHFRAAYIDENIVASAAPLSRPGNPSGPGGFRKSSIGFWVARSPDANRGRFGTSWVATLRSAARSSRWRGDFRAI